MMLQILPPDFKYATETVVVNKAEILSSAFLTSFAFLGLVCISFLVIKITKKNKSSFSLKSKTTSKFVLQS